MNPSSTSWRCQQCGAPFVSVPPEHGLCDQCITDLTTHARESLPDGTTCPSCGGPVCPDCGDALVTVLVSVPIPAPAPVTQQVTRLIAGYRQHRQGLTGDDH